jgi:hypothetical protein
VIDRQKFMGWWLRLETRFGETQGADAYMLYLESQGLETAHFERAASAVWATSRFFPRPADFLLVESGSAWAAVLDHAPRLVPPVDSRDSWEDARASIPERAFTALRSIGGPAAIKNSRDIARTRRDFLDAYELVVISEAHGSLKLASGGKPLAIAAPEPS